MRYRVIQWATGNVGKLAIQSIARHPELELVGVWVHDPAKAGRDAGEIAGIAPLGVRATCDTEALLALDADCVMYCPLPWQVDEMCQILEAGKNVVTTCGYHFPFVQFPEATALLEAACQCGQVSLHSSGSNPGGVSERFPLTFSGWCNRIDRLVMTEYGDCRHYDTPGMIFEVMLFGKTEEEARNGFMLEILKRCFYESIDMVAAGLGVAVARYDFEHEVALATEPIETAAGVIAKGTVAAQRFTYTGEVTGGPTIITRQIWVMDDLPSTRLDPPWGGDRLDGWNIHIEGDPTFDVNIDFPASYTGRQRTRDGMMATAVHCVNAIPAVCRAAPGIRTYLDLPMITARAGRKRSG